MSKHLHAERHGEFLVVQFLDKVIDTDLATGSLGEELYKILDRPDCSNLVLNFSGVEFLGSAMLSKLLSANKMMGQKGGVLRLCEMNPNIRLVFQYTRLDQILDTRGAEADALEL